MNSTLSNDLILFSTQKTLEKSTDKSSSLKRESPDHCSDPKPSKRTKLNNESNPISESIKIDNQPVNETDYIAPWLTSSTMKIKNSLARLHNEIIDFYNYILPSEEEHNSRLEAIKKFALILNLKCLCSYQTGGGDFGILPRSSDSPLRVI